MAGHPPGFTDDDRALIRPALDGAVLFAEGVHELGTSLQEKLTRATRPLFVAACKETTRASRDVYGAAYGLLGGMPLDKGEGTRGEQLAHVWDKHLSRLAGDILTSAVDQVGPCSEKGAGKMADAAAKFKAVALNLGALLHSDPPPGGTFAGRRAIIGPHGDFYRGRHFGWTQTHYMDDWASEGFVPVLETMRVKGRVPMGQTWRLYADLGRLQTYVMALMAGIALRPQWENLPVFFETPQFSMTIAARGLMLRGLDLSKGDGIPAWFSEHENAWLDVLPYVAAAQREAHSQGSRRRSDAWKRENEEAWQDEIFPDGRAG